MNEPGDRSDSKPRADLVRGMVDVINAALGVGTVLARTAATATAGAKTVKDPPAGTAPIPAIIHYSLEAATNMASLVTNALKPAFASGAAAQGNSAGRPRVRPGAVLRVPLSIENPSDRPMTGLQPLVRAVRRGGKDAAADLPFASVRFVPAKLEVAPKDFEKLTVFVTVPETAPAGGYELILALGPKEADLPLAFEVAAAVAA